MNTTACPQRGSDAGECSHKHRTYSVLFFPLNSFPWCGKTALCKNLKYPKINSRTIVEQYEEKPQSAPGL
jgi:hypothetical protein